MRQSLKFSQEELDQEKWAYIENSKNYYISNLGRVKRVYKNHERIMTPFFKRIAPKTLFIPIKFNDNRIKQFRVHHLVAKYFLPARPSPKHVIYHKNKVLNDNRAINLAWITRKELGKKTGGRTSRLLGVVKLNPITKEIVDWYRSCKEAAKENYVSRSTISNNCNGIYKTNCTGYIFKWANQVEF